MDHDHLAQLLLKLIAGQLSDAERAELDALCAADETYRRLCERLQDSRYLEQEYRRRRSVDTTRPLADMRRRIEAAERRRRRPRLLLAAGVAAAVAIVVVLIGVNRYVGRGLSSEERLTAAVTDSAAQALRPGTTQATLTLPNGRQVALGSNAAANRRALAQAAEGKANPSASSASAGKGTTTAQLCLDVPRGGEFKVELEDGTEVWLNAESQLVYPETFRADERRVSLRGEAYFKVKHEEGRPFRVETDGQLLRVYGTQFNIRSYADDPSVRTTLVEGSVALGRLDGKGGEVVLTPGHQSRFDKSHETLSVGSVHTDVVTSWRSGKFVFEDLPLDRIMGDLARWYDFTYSFSDPALRDIVFMGSIPRYADFNTALAVIEKSGGLRLTVSGRHVSVARR